MSLTGKQYADIMNAYSKRRSENRLEEIRRQDEIYTAVPEIRKIDQEIAHISLEAARYMLFHPEENKREELRSAVRSLSEKKTGLLVSSGYPPDYLGPVHTCYLCEDTGYIGSRKCSCLLQYEAEILYGQSNLADKAARARFSHFCLDYYSDEISERQTLSPRENMRGILSQCRRFLTDFDTIPGQNLLIYGRAGVGKTFLSHCIAGELLDRGKSVVYLTSYQFFHHLEEYTFRRDRGHEDTLANFLSCDLLIVDDLGTEMNNSFVNSQLFLCVNERILNRKSTIINTNLSLKQISRTYSERVSSRIIESYLLLYLYGDDIRIKKAVSSLDEGGDEVL